VPTVGVVQPGVDLLDHLIEAVGVLPFDPRDLVLVRRLRLDVLADGVKCIAEAADQLLGNASCAEG
jgi:hypothetical protein